MTRRTRTSGITLSLEAQVDTGWNRLRLDLGPERAGLRTVVVALGSEDAGLRVAELRGIHSRGPWILVLYVPAGVRTLRLTARGSWSTPEPPVALSVRRVSRWRALFERGRGVAAMLLSAGAPRRRALDTLIVSGRAGGLRGVVDALLAPPDSPMYITPADVAQSGPPRPDETALARLRESALAMSEPPLISVLMPVYNADVPLLEAAIDSVRSQTYPHWQLCIADDASTDPAVHACLNAAAASDPRIRVCLRERNGHISEASNSALALCEGRFVALLDQDDLLAPHALHTVAVQARRDSRTRLMYSDEDKIDEEGRHFGPYHKPDWDPFLLLGQNVFSHLGVFETELVRAVGGFRVGYEGSQDYDLVLRCLARAGDAAVAHLPHVLYHWRALPGSTAHAMSAKSYAADAAVRALTEALARQYRAGRIEPAGFAGGYRYRPDPPEQAPRISIIPVGEPRNPRRWARQLQSLAAAAHIELVLPERYVMPAMSPVEIRRVASAADSDPPASRLNALVRAASADLVLLLHPALVPARPDALAALAAYFVRAEVAAVAPRIVDARHRTLHAGYVRGLFGRVGSPFESFPAETPGYFGQLRLLRCASAASAAALMIRRDVFLETGGFDAAAHPWQEFDVEWGVRLGRAGYRLLVAPDADWIEPGRSSRRRGVIGWYWPGRLREPDAGVPAWRDLPDPFYNPNLTLAHCAFFVDQTPRVPQPWEIERG